MSITYPLALPDARAFSAVRVTARSVVAVGASPFTGQQQVQEHQGQWWEAECSLPPMKRPAAEAWISFFLKLNGRRGTFLMGDTAASAPRGTIAGSPVVDGAHAVRAATLALRGVTAGTTLLAGDYIQVGTGAAARMHKNLNDATADGLGKMTLDIWPTLRSALSDGAAVITSGCLTTWRLASNDMPFEVGLRSIYGLTFAAVEAI